MRTVISAWAFPPATTGLVFHALSIDQPINPDFVNSQPELIKRYTYYGGRFWFEKVYDLAPGTHTLYYRNTSDLAWDVHLFADDTELLIQRLATNYWSATFTVPSSKNIQTVYQHFPEMDSPISEYLKYVISDSTMRRLCFPATATNYVTPQPTGISGAGTLYMPFLTFHCYIGSPGSFSIGNRNLLWVGFKNWYRILHTFYHLPILMLDELSLSRWHYPARTCVEAGTGGYICAYSIGIPCAENRTLEYGYVRPEGEQTLNPEDFIVQGTITLPLIETGTSPPPSYYGSLNPTKYELSLSNPIAPTTDTTLACYVYFQIPTGSPSGVIPFIYIKETPQPQTLRTDKYRKPGESFSLLTETWLNNTILQKGYFTIVYGRVLPKSPYLEALGEIQIPLKVGADITNVTLSKIAPAIGARIENFSLSRIAAALGADITTFSLSKIAPTIGARIESFELSSITAPPPPPTPPPQVATLTGKVVSFFGPVADAEVTLNDKTVRTDSSGRFTIENIPYGTYTLTVKPTRLFPIPEKILLKTVTREENIYASKSEVITLPLNWINAGVMATTPIIVGAIVAYKATAKPKYYY